MPTDEQLAAIAPEPVVDDGGASSPYADMTWGNLGSFAQQHPFLTGMAGAVNPALTLPAALASGYGAAEDVLAPSQNLQQRVDQAKALPDAAPVAPAMPQSQSTQGGYPAMPQVPNVGVGGGPRNYQGEIDAGTKEQQAGIQQAAAANMAAAQIKAQNEAEQAKQQIANAQQSQAARNAAYSDVSSKMDATAKQMQDAANEKVDPNHWWSSRNEAQKASAALGLALSSAATVFGAKPVDLVNQAIDRDIQAQRDNISNRRQGLAQQANLYQNQYQIFGNHQDASDMTKAHMLDGLAKQGDAAAAQAATPAIAAQATQAAGQLSQQAANLKSQVAQRQFQQGYQSNMLKLDAYGKQLQAWQMGRMIGANGMQLRPEDLQEIKKQEAAVRNLQEGAAGNAAALGNITTGDRIHHFLSQGLPIPFMDKGVGAGLFADAPVYGQLNANQEKMAVNGNVAQGIATAQTEKQYENMREGANTPNSPEKGEQFSQSQVEGARDALAATYAARFGVPIDQARAMVQQRIGVDPWAAENVRAEIGKKAGTR